MLKSRTYIKPAQLNVSRLASSGVRRSGLTRVLESEYSSGTMPRPRVARIAISDSQVRGEVGAFAANYLTRTGKQPVPGLEHLGCGYNAFSLYADGACIKRRFLDFSSLSSVDQRIGGQAYTAPTGVTVLALNNAGRHLYKGETATRYVHSFSIGAGIGGSFMGFGGEVETRFDSNQIESYYSAFSCIREVINSYRLSIDGSPSQLRGLVPQSLLDQLDGGSAAQLTDLFEQYGLYILAGMVMGGRSCYASSTNLFKYESSQSWSVSAEASYLSLAHADVESRGSEAVRSFDQSSESDWDALGGNEALALQWMADPSAQRHDAWIQSVITNPQFVDFTDPGAVVPLIPIWKFAASATRAQEVEAAARVFANERWPAFNNPNAQTREYVNYEVATRTSNIDSAGTDADVFIRLCGRDRFGRGWASNFLRHDTAGDDHEKGSVDRCQYRLLDLGSVTAIDVENRGGGNKPAWNLARIDIRPNAPYAKDVSTQYDKWINPGQRVRINFE